jgi:predicted DsbA family dithiol-disulfide isomerase
VQLDIWSDIICPWCYIGMARFERALERFDGKVEIRLHPFALDPQAPIPGEPARERYQRRFGEEAEAMMERVASEARALGLPIDWNRAVTPNTFDAHRLIMYAQRAQRDRAMERRLFRAYFAEGLDVSDRDVLAGLGAETGFIRADVAAYLESDDGVDDVRAEFAGAFERGITAVPSFLFEDEFLVPGAADELTFSRILSQMRTVS